MKFVLLTYKQIKSALDTGRAECMVSLLPILNKREIKSVIIQDGPYSFRARSV